MKQFAQLDSNNIVIQVIAVPDDYDTDAKGSDYINNTLGLSGKWLQTCLYTQGNVLLSAAAKTITHTRVDGKGDVTIFVPAITGLPLRYNFASIGYKYDPVNDAFYDSVQPFPSWNLDYTTYTWKPPVLYPADGSIYTWNESLTAWTLMIPLSTLQLRSLKTNTVSGIN